MIQENEIVTLILGVSVLLYFLSKASRIREFPEWKVFSGAFFVYMVGWIFAVVEGLWVGFPAGIVLENLLNASEHVCYAVSSLLLTLWCWKTLWAPARRRSDSPAN